MNGTETNSEFGMGALIRYPLLCAELDRHTAGLVALLKSSCRLQFQCGQRYSHIMQEFRVLPASAAKFRGALPIGAEV